MPDTQPPAAALAVVPALHVAGVSPGSPLLARLRAALGPGVALSAGGDLPQGDPPAILRGTALDWRGAPAPAVPCPADAVLLDLHGAATGAAGRVWRVVDAAGRPVLAPRFARDHCCGPEGLVPFFLVESLDGGRSWSALGSAHPSAARPYPQLLAAIGHAMVAMVAAALLSPQPGTAWQPGPAPRRDTPWRWRIAHARQRLHDKLTAEHWAIGTLAGPPDRLAQGGTVTPERWFALPTAEGFLADPFPWPGRPGVMLCERFDHATGLGRLQAMRFDGDGLQGVEEVPLDVRGHLSYPFAFAAEGRVWCLPEMAASRRQVLYELSPGAPPRPACTVAEDVAWADATVFRHAGLWWIAYTDTDLGVHDNLCLRWAERLEGPWFAHARNPVKIDVRSARCAGGLFRLGEALVRPAQDCARGYGVAIVLNRVLDCTPDTYREEELARLLPDPAGPYPDGLHTIALADGVLLTDGKRVVFDPAILLKRVRRVLARR